VLGKNGDGSLSGHVNYFSSLISRGGRQMGIIQREGHVDDGVGVWMKGQEYVLEGLLAALC
jgi:hypothetical protein